MNGQNSINVRFV